MTRSYHSGYPHVSVTGHGQTFGRWTPFLHASAGMDPAFLVFASAGLSSRLLLVSLAPGSRRHAHELLERAVEGGLGFVADLDARIGEACAPVDEARREVEPPARHILHRRDLDELREPVGKGGAGQADLPCQPVQGPRTVRSAMDQACALAPLRIRHTAPV